MRTDLVTCWGLPVPQRSGYHQTLRRGHRPAPLQVCADDGRGLQHQPGGAGGEQPQIIYHNGRCDCQAGGHFTFSHAINPGRGMVVCVACSAKGGRCGPGRNTFWEQTAVCYIMYPSRTPIKTRTTSCLLVVSVASPNRSIPTT